MKQAIKLKSNLAKEIIDTFSGIHRVSATGYIKIGDNILAVAAYEGQSTSNLCKTMARVIKNFVCSATLRNCVLLAKTYSDKRTREQLNEMAPKLEHVINLAHSQYDGKRGKLLCEIRQGKRSWRSVTTPGREASAVRQKQASKRQLECKPDCSGDPNEIRIKLIDNGEVNSEGIEDGFAAIITRTSLELATKLFQQATRRVGK